MNTKYPTTVSTVVVNPTSIALPHLRQQWELRQHRVACEPCGVWEHPTWGIDKCQVNLNSKRNFQNFPNSISEHIIFKDFQPLASSSSARRNAPASKATGDLKLSMSSNGFSNSMSSRKMPSHRHAKVPRVQDLALTLVPHVGLVSTTNNWYLDLSPTESKREMISWWIFPRICKFH